MKKIKIFLLLALFNVALCAPAFAAGLGVLKLSSSQKKIMFGEDLKITITPEIGNWTLKNPVDLTLMLIKPNGSIEQTINLTWPPEPTRRELCPGLHECPLIYPTYNEAGSDVFSFNTLPIPESGTYQVVGKTTGDVLKVTSFQFQLDSSLAKKLTVLPDSANNYQIDDLREVNPICFRIGYADVAGNNLTHSTSGRQFWIEINVMASPQVAAMNLEEWKDPRYSLLWLSGSYIIRETPSYDDPGVREIEEAYLKKFPPSGGLKPIAKHIKVGTK